MTRAAARIGVLGLQGDVREHLTALSRCGATGVLVRRPEEISGLDGIVLPGGESTTMSKLARIFGVLEPLREAIGSGLPAFGTCAGMILLADRIEDGAVGQETIGGLDVVVRRNAFGRQVDSFEADVDVEPGDRPGFSFPATFIRGPWVEKVGSDVDVVARVADRPGSVGRIVAVRQARLLATSFHPEIAGDARIHEVFVDMVRDG
jgi:pyridoxal 5'-phosphate synthase pdxT subunit